MHGIFHSIRVWMCVRGLDQKMDFVHRYLFATAPRDIENTNMAIEKLGSRQNGLDINVADDLQALTFKIKALADIQDEHNNALMSLGPDVVRDRHAPPHPEPPPGVEPQHGSVEHTSGPRTALEPSAPSILVTLHANIESQSQKILKLEEALQEQSARAI